MCRSRLWYLSDACTDHAVAPINTTRIASFAATYNPNPSSSGVVKLFVLLAMVLYPWYAATPMYGCDDEIRGRGGRERGGGVRGALDAGHFLIHHQPRAPTFTLLHARTPLLTVHIETHNPFAFSSFINQPRQEDLNSPAVERGGQMRRCTSVHLPHILVFCLNQDDVVYH
jgi:hypothetical protein